MLYLKNVPGMDERPGLTLAAIARKHCGILEPPLADQIEAWARAPDHARITHSRRLDMLAVADRVRELEGQLVRLRRAAEPKSWRAFWRRWKKPCLSGCHTQELDVDGPH